MRGNLEVDDELRLSVPPHHATSPEALRMRGIRTAVPVSELSVRKTRSYVNPQVADATRNVWAHRFDMVPLKPHSRRSVQCSGAHRCPQTNAQHRTRTTPPSKISSKRIPTRHWGPRLRRIPHYGNRSARRAAEQFAGMTLFVLTVGRVWSPAEHGLGTKMPPHVIVQCRIASPNERLGSFR